MTRRAVLLTVVLGLLGTPSAVADRGSIPFDPSVKVFEPNQRAMIAWNGREEILVLSTDLKASSPTKVLEVIPLPSEPTVTKGDPEVFRKATELINRRLAQTLGPQSRSEKSSDAARGPAGLVTEHKQIGAHDLTTTRVLHPEGFVQWVEDYLRKAGVDNPTISPAMKGVVREYLDDDYKWFVFDVVDLGDATVTNQPIQYRFASKHLYYPLRITRAEEGDTTVTLLVLTPRLLNHFPGLPIDRVQLAHQPISLNAADVRELSKEMAELLGPRADMKLRIWEVRGRLSGFTADLLAGTR